MTRTLLAALALAALGACGGPREPDLLTFARGDEGPEEFGIVPNRPLEAPESYAVLPTPTPGGANRADQTPLSDAVAALGGNPAAGAGGVPAGDAGLVTYAARGGVDPAIRAELAAADLEFRRDSQGRILERLFSVNVYNRAYARFELDQYAELLRWRRAGVRTPSAPPDPAR